MSVRFPYSFKGLPKIMEVSQLKKSNTVHHSMAVGFLGEGIYNSFSHVYTNTLQAIEDQDEEFLKSIMERSLFNVTMKSIHDFNSQGLKLKYIQDPTAEVGKEVPRIPDENEKFNEIIMEALKKQQDSTILDLAFSYKEQDMSILLDCRGAFGVKINREENSKNLFQFPKDPSVGRHYYLNFTDPLAVFRNCVLITNVLMKTSRKLVAVDNEGNVVHGSDDINVEYYHKWRFETYTPDFEWVLTDIDDYLKGNPYI